MNKFTVGQKLYILTISSSTKDEPELKEGTIEKITRRWLYVKDEDSNCPGIFTIFDINTMTSKPGFMFKKAFRTKEEYFNKGLKERMDAIERVRDCLIKEGEEFLKAIG